MTDIIPDKDVLELALQLARIYSDEGFRTRVENDELKQAGVEGEILLQFEPEKLKEAAVLLFQLHRWVNGRERRARERQDAKTATALGLSPQQLQQLRTERYEKGVDDILFHRTSDDFEELAKAGHR